LIEPPHHPTTLTRRELVLAVIAAVNSAVALLAVVAYLSAAPAAPAPAALQASEPSSSFHAVFETHLASAKYIDLTHTIEPGMPLWPAFDTAGLQFSAALAGSDGGMGTEFIDTGEEFTYAKQGFIATQVTLPTDQMGTQLDPPAHWNEYGATISDLPPTVSLRPLVVIDLTAKVASDPGYFAQVADVEAWEAAHGRVPAGSVVFFRTDWSKAWPGEPFPFASVSLAVLKFLHEERAILFHGHEPLDTDLTDSLEGEAWLMHHDYMQAEGVANLDQVPETGCLLSIGFPKIKGGSGGYARYVAICPTLSPFGVSVADAPGAPLPRQTAPLRRGANGVLTPSPGATPTTYCAPGSPSLGCPPVDWSEPI
jgi:kynurenine formamidase